MLTLTKKPDWNGRRPPEDLNSFVPKFQYGKAIQWLGHVCVNPVFLKQFPLLQKSHEAYLLGTRYSTASVIRDGKPGAQGHFLQFFILDFLGTDLAAVHPLQQHRSPIFSKEGEPRDWVWAEDIGNSEQAELSKGGLPKWKKSEAQWPTLGGRKMFFVGQVYLPDCEVARNWLTWDLSVFLFWISIDGVSHFKIFTQSTSAQTAEMHYADEEQRG